MCMLPRCSPLWTEWCPSSTFWATRLCRGSSAAQNDAVNRRAKVHLGGWVELRSPASWPVRGSYCIACALLLSCPCCLLLTWARMTFARCLLRRMVWLINHSALSLIAMLRHHNLLPKQVVFLSVIQRTPAGCSREVSWRMFNSRAKALNATLAARTQAMSGVHLFAGISINLPKFICIGGCHLNEDGEAKYSQGIRRVILRYANRCI